MSYAPATTTTRLEVVSQHLEKLLNGKQTARITIPELHRLRIAVQELEHYASDLNYNVELNGMDVIITKRSRL